MRTSAAVDPRFAVSVRCFGGFALGISDSEVELSHLRPQARTVLRVLATHAGRPVHRDRLACALWNDTDPLPTLHHLQVHISNLRKLAPRRPDGSHHPFIVRVGETYALAVDGRGACDLSDFDAHFQGALRAQASGDIEHAAHCLQRGVDLYRGEVLPEDGDADWVSEVRDRYRLRAAEAACLLAQTELILGRTTAAAAAATRSIEIDPWRDESWRTLMAIHRSTGDIMSAERAQQRYEQMLASLSVHPGTTTPVSRPDPAAGAVPAATALPGHAPMHLWKRP